MSWMLIIFKVIYFQLLWYVSAYWGAHNWHLQAFALCLLSLYFDYLIFRYQNLQLKKYIAFIAGLGLFGLIFDQTFSWLGLLSWQKEVFYPASLLGIWVMFAAYYPELFSKFDKRPLVSFILGAIFGPLAYWTGSKIGALHYDPHQTYAFLLHGLCWGLFFTTSISLFNLIKHEVPHGSRQYS